MEKEANQQSKVMNQESENCRRVYLVNIFAKKRKIKALKRWRERNALRNVSQIKGNGRIVLVLQGRTEEGKQLIMFYVCLYVKVCKC